MKMYSRMIFGLAIMSIFSTVSVMEACSLIQSRIHRIGVTDRISHSGTQSNSYLLFGLKPGLLPLRIQMQLDSLTDYAVMSLAVDSITVLPQREQLTLTNPQCDDAKMYSTGS